MPLIPLGVFGELPAHVRCSGSALDVGAPVVIGDEPVARVRSIAELRDRAGALVGWVYLADRDDALFVQAHDTTKGPELRALRLQRSPVPGPSTVAPLDAPLAPLGLHVTPCSVVEQKIVD